MLRTLRGRQDYFSQVIDDKLIKRKKLLKNEFADGPILVVK